VRLRVLCASQPHPNARSIAPVIEDGYLKLVNSDHYSAAHGAARLHPSLRERIVFSDHSLATDSVFAEVQLISCRNVLIYFNRTLQERVIALFRDALCHRGFLGLGSRESLRFTAHADAFEELARVARIYQKVAA
jgi:chemotaxis protein methyltransferase CheR